MDQAESIYGFGETANHGIIKNRKALDLFCDAFLE
jgi:hypothetical protein